ncbi:MAG TPA: flagellin, partial [Phycisphaerales bacterium]|nr:flagellin [Phycisphaerales bacterium]
GAGTPGQVAIRVGPCDHLAGTQRFNGHTLLDHAWTHRLGQINVAVPRPDGSTHVEARSLRDLSNAGGLNLRTGDLSAAQESVQAAITGIATIRAGIGARTQKLESMIRTSRSEIENLSAARSRVLDTDYAAETSNAIRARTLQQASLLVMKTMLESGRERVLGLLSCVSARRGG